VLVERARARQDVGQVGGRGAAEPEHGGNPRMVRARTCAEDALRASRTVAMSRADVVSRTDVLALDSLKAGP